MSAAKAGGGQGGVRYRGLQELINFNKKLPSLLNDAANQGFRQQAPSLLSATQRVVPVRTGKLKRSGGQQAGNLFLSIFYDAPYAGFVDLGTSRMSPRHYFFRILESHEGKVIAGVNGNIAKIIKTNLGSSK